MGLRKTVSRSLCGLLALVLVLSFALPVNGIKWLAPAETPEYIYTVRIHCRASAGSAVMGQLEDGTLLQVAKAEGSYYRIVCPQMEGYIRQALVEQRDGEYYVNYIEGEPDTLATPARSLSQALQLRSSLVQLAREQVGAPYIYGRSAPGGFDCSGLTSYLYRSLDMQIQRCADDQMADGLIVAQEGLQVGDLVFFRESWSPWLASHVGIYVGDGQMIHADSRGVRYDSVLEGFYGDIYVGARRIVNTLAPAQEQLPTAATGFGMQRTAAGLRTAG